MESVVNMNMANIDLYLLQNLPIPAIARIATVTPQQAEALAAARGVRVDSRNQLLVIMSNE